MVNNHSRKVLDTIIMGDEAGSCLLRRYLKGDDLSNSLIPAKVCRNKNIIKMRNFYLPK